MEELVISTLKNVTVVSFRSGAIINALTIDRIGKQLLDLVDKQALTKIVLDMGDVQFLSSAMIGALIAMHKGITKIKGKVIIAGLKKDIMKVFTVSKLDKVLNFADDESKALAAFGVFVQ